MGKDQDREEGVKAAYRSILHSLSGLISCSFLRHVQQEFLIARFHFRKQPAQSGEVIGFAARASEFGVFRSFQPAR
jgi:hypothetical protein